MEKEEGLFYESYNKHPNLIVGAIKVLARFAYVKLVRTIKTLQITVSFLWHFVTNARLVNRFVTFRVIWGVLIGNIPHNRERQLNQNERTGDCFMYVASALIATLTTAGEVFVEWFTALPESHGWGLCTFALLRILGACTLRTCLIRRAWLAPCFGLII